MECNVSDLVKRGHDKAAQLKSSGGAVSQLISDLAAQLDVQLARSNALAAENAGLKNQLRELFNSCDTGERRGNGSLSGAAVPDWCVLEKTRQFLESAPATDAFLAEVRAQGVEMMASEAEQLMDEFGDDSYIVMVTADLQRFANAFAAQLRKGVQS